MKLKVEMTAEKESLNFTVKGLRAVGVYGMTICNVLCFELCVRKAQRSNVTLVKMEEESSEEVSEEACSEVSSEEVSSEEVSTQETSSEARVKTFLYIG